VLCACQAVDLRAPIVSSDALMGVHAAVRARVPALDADRAPGADIETIAACIEAGALEHAAGVVVN
jgi:histidine ammonia-lyase